MRGTAGRWSLKTAHRSRWRRFLDCVPSWTRKPCVLVGAMMDVLGSWRMKTAMNHPTSDRRLAPIERQGTLDLNGSGRWQELPGSARDDCLLALAQLFYQVITRQPEESENEREDTTPSS